MPPSLDRLQRRLGYEFVQIDRLTKALTHRSAARENNERLEFLGDAVLGQAVAETLYERYADEGEDVLTLLRSQLVKGTTLAEIARELDLGDFLILGAGEAGSGGHKRASILADAVEAVIGAVHLDGGGVASRALIDRLWAQRFASAQPENLKDPKTQLQEWLQKRGEALPSYAVVATSGAEHERVFEVACSAQGREATAVGRSRRAAEKAAARELLNMLRDDS